MRSQPSENTTVVKTDEGQPTKISSKDNCSVCYSSEFLMILKKINHEKLKTDSQKTWSVWFRPS